MFTVDWELFGSLFEKIEESISHRRHANILVSYLWSNYKYSSVFGLLVPLKYTMGFHFNFNNDAS